jgi:hypothetical protein
MSAVAPDERRVDRDQLRVLVRLALKQGLGRGTDASTGAKGYPLLQILFSMTFLGIVLSFNAGRVSDVESFLVLIFAVVFVITVLAINPDTQEVQERRLEILASKPVAPPTFLSARALVLLALASLLAGCLGLAPTVTALVFFPGARLRTAASYPTLVVGSFAVAVVWLSLVMIAVRWISIERVRKTSQLLLLAAIVGVNVLSLGWIPFGGPAGSRFSVAAWPATAWLPSSWFALFWMDDGSPAAWLRRAAVAALLGLAGLVASGRIFSSYYANFAEQSVAPAARPSRALLTRLLDGFARVPGLRRLLPAPVHAVAAAVLTVTRREDVSRTKTLVPQVMAVGAFALSLWGGAPLAAVSMTMLTYLGFSSVLDGLQVTRQSSHPAAGWIFWGTPLAPRHVVRGLTTALTLRFLFLPAALLAVLFFRRHPPALAAFLSLAYVLTARLVIPLGLVVWPAKPLSHEQRATQSLGGFVVGFVLAISFAVAQAMVELLAPMFGVVAFVLGVFGLFVLAMASWGLAWSAAERLARLEYPY